jgi:hypothetical protein
MICISLQNPTGFWYSARMQGTPGAEVFQIEVQKIKKKHGPLNLKSPRLQNNNGSDLLSTDLP